MLDDYGNEAGRVETAIVEGAPQIRLIGECDLYTAPAVQQHVRGLLEGGETRIVFDLEHVTFLDSTILRIFLMAHRHVGSAGGVVLLCRPGFVQRLLCLLEIDRLVRVCTPEDWRRQNASLH